MKPAPDGFACFCNRELPTDIYLTLNEGCN